MIRKIRYALKHFWQRRTRGFDDTELWGLDWTFIKYMLPRLKAFHASKIHGYPVGIAVDFRIEEDALGYVGLAVWKGVIAQMIWSMEHWLETEGMPGWDGKTINEELEHKYQHGMDLFHIYFHALWD